MIQEGKVGVGIMGLEGAQAALAADYAIPRFKHLRRLCCVHGRYAVARNALCIYVSLYKGFLIAAMQFIFAFFCGFSAQTLLDGWLLTIFNLWFTTLPPFLIGCFEKDVPEEILEVEPQLYADMRDGELFNAKIIATWYADATFHSLALFVVWGPVFSASFGFGYHPIDIVAAGVCYMCAVIALSVGKMALHTRYWTFIQIAGYLFCVVITISVLFAYSSVKNLFHSTGFYGQGKLVLSSLLFWLILGFAASLLCCVDLAIQLVRRRSFPTRAMTLVDEFLNPTQPSVLARQPDAESVFSALVALSSDHTPEDVMSRQSGTATETPMDVSRQFTSTHSRTASAGFD